MEPHERAALKTYASRGLTPKQKLEVLREPTLKELLEQELAKVPARPAPAAHSTAKAPLIDEGDRMAADAQVRAEQDRKLGLVHGRKGSPAKAFLRSAGESAVDMLVGQVPVPPLAKMPRDLTGARLVEDIADLGSGTTPAQTRRDRTAERVHHPTASVFGTLAGDAAAGALPGGLLLGAERAAARTALARSNPEAFRAMRMREQRGAVTSGGKPRNFEKELKAALKKGDREAYSRIKLEEERAFRNELAAKLPASKAEKKPGGDDAGKDADRVLGIARDLKSQLGHSNIPKMRDAANAAGMSNEAFDKALLKLESDGKLILHHNDLPFFEPDKDRFLVVPTRGHGTGGSGKTYYHAAFVKDDPVPTPGKAFAGDTGAIRQELKRRAITGFAEGSLSGAGEASRDENASLKDILKHAALSGAVGSALGKVDGPRRLRDAEGKPVPVLSDSARDQDIAREVFGKPMSPRKADALLGNHPALQGAAPDVYMSSSRRDGRPSLTLDAGLTTKGGRGRLENTYLRNAQGELEVEHGSVFLPDDVKSKGVGKDILRQQVAEYDRLGARRVNLSAAEDGRYVWARMGFEASEDSMRDVRAAYSDYLRRRGVDPSSVRMGSIGEVAATPEGKAFLLSGRAPEWKGSVDLRGASGERLRAYLGLGAPKPKARSTGSKNASTSSSKSDARSKEPGGLP